MTIVPTLRQRIPPTFEAGKVYRDSVGRRWRVTYIFREYRGRILVRRVWRPWVKRVAVVDDDFPGTATVMLGEGFTTIYADTEGERWHTPHTRTSPASSSPTRAGIG